MVKVAEAAAVKAWRRAQRWTLCVTARVHCTLNNRPYKDDCELLLESMHKLTLALKYETI